MPRECLPEHLRDKLHNDWPWPMSKISRNSTSWCGDPPTLVEGDTLKPIPLPGQFTRQIANLAPDTPSWVPRYYYAITYANGVHVRIGTRYDDIDGYYTFPSFTVKKPYGDPPFNLPEGAMAVKKATKKKKAVKEPAAEPEAPSVYFQVQQYHASIGGMFHFHLRKGNGEAVMTSVPYNSKEECYQAIGLVMETTDKTRVEDVTPNE